MMNKSFHNTHHYMQRKKEHAQTIKLCSNLSMREKLIVLLVGHGGKPVPSVEHLGAELFLVERALGVDNGPIRTPRVTYYPSGKP
jgi:hypothetical protein